MHWIVRVADPTDCETIQVKVFTSTSINKKGTTNKETFLLGATLELNNLHCIPLESRACSNRSAIPQFRGERNHLVLFISFSYVYNLHCTFCDCGGNLYKDHQHGYMAIPLLLLLLLFLAHLKRML